MNWDQIEGNWKQAIGQAKKQWGRFSRDQLIEMGGSKDILVGKIQEAYGVTREEAERQVNEWQVAFDDASGLFPSSSDSFAARARSWSAAGSDLGEERASSPALDAAVEWWHDARRTVTRSVDVLGACVEERPLFSLGCAVGVGLVLGLVIGRR